MFVYKDFIKELKMFIPEMISIATTQILYFHGPELGKMLFQKR